MRRHRGAVLVVAALAVAGCGGGSGGGGGSSGGGGGGAKATSTAKAGGSTASAGAQLFASNGCSGCHTFAAASATGTTGPDFDKQLKSDAKADGKALPAFVKQSITEPDAYVAKGYQPGIMPKTFGGSLSSTQLAALVAFITNGVK